MIIPELFLSHKNNFIGKTLFDEDRSILFSSKIFWLVRIMKNHSIFKMKSMNLMK
jgi:hypothetical protein